MGDQHLGAVGAGGAVLAISPGLLQLCWVPGRAAELQGRALLPSPLHPELKMAARRKLMVVEDGTGDEVCLWVMRVLYLVGGRWCPCVPQLFSPSNAEMSKVCAAGAWCTWPGSTVVYFHKKPCWCYCLICERCVGSTWKPLAPNVAEMMAAFFLFLFSLSPKHALFSIPLTVTEEDNSIVPLAFGTALAQKHRPVSQPGLPSSTCALGFLRAGWEGGHASPLQWKLFGFISEELSLTPHLQWRSSSVLLSFWAERAASEQHLTTACCSAHPWLTSSLCAVNPGWASFSSFNILILHLIFNKHRNDENATDCVTELWIEWRLLRILLFFNRLEFFFFNVFKAKQKLLLQQKVTSVCCVLVGPCANKHKSRILCVCETERRAQVFGGQEGSEGSSYSTARRGAQPWAERSAAGWGPGREAQARSTC